MTGRIMVDSRVHFQKRFHLAERVLDGIEVAETPSTDEFRRWHVERSLHAMGAATEADLRGYLTFPRMGRGVREQALASMLQSGEVVEVGVEDDRARWFALARDLPALGRAAAASAPLRGTALLAPFDSLMWYRERIERLFGFEYRIEVYTPGHKRVHGYYNLPILHDGRMIGRLDAKNHRDRKRLEVRHAHFERWFANGAASPGADSAPVDRVRALAALAETLESLATFLGAERIELRRVTPSRLAPALRSALRESRAVAV
jgi:hypothetical protein